MAVNQPSVIKEIIKEPMVILLLTAAAFYFVMGQYTEGIIMAGAILLVAGMSAYQQKRSESALRALNKLTQQQITVLRNGRQQQIDKDELVVDDLMMVNEGQLVSADGEITELNDFSVDESILTGESLAVEKQNPGEMIYSGTTVTSGMAWARVTAVGKHTRAGELGTLMDETIKGKTPLQKQVSNFVKLMAFFGIAAFVVVWLINFLMSGNVLDSLMHGLTLAMAVLPEEIPVALSTFMALGAYKMIKQHILAKHPQTVESLGAATVICLDKTGTITINQMHVDSLYDFKADVVIDNNMPDMTGSASWLVYVAMLACEEDPFDPMETAIHKKFQEKNEFPAGINKIKEYPISGAHPMMTHIYRTASGENIIATKGAPEGIIQRSNLNSGEINKIHAVLKKFASKGYRVLAVARGIETNGTLPRLQQDFEFEFLGLVALNDPPRKNIPSVIKSFYDAGIEVKMITGDYPETASAIAEQVGIKNSASVVHGDAIVKMSDAQLMDAAGKNPVFARVKPKEKLRIINALKNAGHVVAMTGDGVNDGPALKAANIGIAMGKRGSEVARIAASLVLVTDDLSKMTVAIEYGRNIYSNLKKAIQYIISIHIPLISMVTLPVILGWKFPNIFSPVHVIFLELIMGPTCSIVYENEPMNRKLMLEPPRKPNDALFTWRELAGSLVQGVAIVAGLMALMYLLIQQGGSETYVRTMIFTTLVLANILLTLTGRSVHEPLFKTIFYRNYLVPVIITITLLLLALSLTITPVMHVFEFNALSASDIINCFLVAVVSVSWIDLVKIIRLKLKSKVYP